MGNLEDKKPQIKCKKKLNQRPMRL
jgi:hypothetical protein